MSSANAFNLDQSKNLSFGKELRKTISDSDTNGHVGEINRLNDYMYSMICSAKQSINKTNKRAMIALYRSTG